MLMKGFLFDWFFYRYYVVDFDHRKYAVSIRSSSPVLRSTREGWGSHKLAVEGMCMVIATV